MRSPKSHTSYDVYNYLEKDVQRLEKLDDFISIRLANWIKFSQTTTLLKQQRELRLSKEDALIQQNLNLASPIHHNFAALWNKILPVLSAAVQAGQDKTVSLTVPAKDA